MMFAEVSAWALWVATITLTLILYLRVKLHDWGMVGLTIFLFGASVLTTRTMLRQYDLEYGGDSSLYAWRILVLIGTPIAITGYVVGWKNNPPPRRQVLTRLAVLIVALLVPVALYAFF